MTTQLTPRIGLVAINCRHVHTSPAVRILRNIALDLGAHDPATDVWYEEFNLGDPLWKMADAILRHDPSVVGLSVYLWNRRQQLELARTLKAVRPDICLIAGGPELADTTVPPEGFDHLIRGEGEAEWTNLLSQLFGWPQPSSPPPPNWAYQNDTKNSLHDRLVYVETSRGCPYQCSFCTSGCKSDFREWTSGSREEFLTHLRSIAQHDIRGLKFLDRTFNANPRKALEWFRVLADLPGPPCHFEINAELLDQATLSFLAGIPKGKFQFEVGVQSLNPKVLAAIGRRSDPDRLLARLQELLSTATVHVHADLIWGLPADSFENIISDFNRMCRLPLHELQLGFLKLLPGTPLARNKPPGFLTQREPPYEVLATDRLSGEQLLRLKRIEHVFDLFYNSKRFRRSLAYLTQPGHEHSRAPFELFEQLSNAFVGRDLLRISLGLDALYEVFFNTFQGPPLLADYLRLDYATSQRMIRLPRFLTYEGPGSFKAIPTTSSGPLVIALEHALDCEQRVFSEEVAPALYSVRHGQGNGYFSDVSLQLFSQRFST